MNLKKKATFGTLASLWRSGGWAPEHSALPSLHGEGRTGREETLFWRLPAAVPNSSHGTSSAAPCLRSTWQHACHFLACL